MATASDLTLRPVRPADRERIAEITRDVWDGHDYLPRVFDDWVGDASAALPTRVYWGADVPMRVIRRFARQVAERFHPDKIILFGSHAYGTPHADSDVDILVVMPARSQLDQAWRIQRTIDPPFPVHVIVRTPYNMAWRLKESESFLREVVAKGKVLYEKAHPRVGQEGGDRLSRRPPTPG